MVIFSDSLSSLSAIKTGKSSCRPQMFDKILNLINEIQVDIHFVWIPSHFKGNERLDRLAQNATKTRLLKISI